ncbi:MAG: hypothetical protein A2220_00765 [Ignavibacteria bacterium RIFOXYA2_FULL_35_10]|nr:MAG: hypothetical protein A2220_00765 [Ignavibacteria bacterium RIFOXYA2_FULL_35_10]
MKKDLIIKTLQDKWKQRIYHVKTKDAEKLGPETSKKEIKIGNFILKKKVIPPGYSININDDDKDLDNFPYSENIKAFRHLEDLYKDKKL